MVKVPTPAYQGEGAPGSLDIAAARTPYQQLRAPDLSAPARDIGNLGVALGNAANVAAAVMRDRAQTTKALRHDNDKLALGNSLAEIDRQLLREAGQRKGGDARGMTDSYLEVFDNEVAKAMETLTPADEEERVALRAVVQARRIRLGDALSRYEMAEEERYRKVQNSSLMANYAQDAAFAAYDPTWLSGLVTSATASAARIAVEDGQDPGSAARAARTAVVASAIDRLVADDKPSLALSLLDKYKDGMDQAAVSKARASLQDASFEEQAMGVVQRVDAARLGVVTPEGQASQALIAGLVMQESSFDIPAGVDIREYVRALPVEEAAALMAVKGPPTNAAGDRAVGITQIMEATARKPGYGVAPYKYIDGVPEGVTPNEVLEEQVRFAQDYMNAMLDLFDGDVEMALTAYHSGPGNVRQGKIGPQGSVYAAQTLSKVKLPEGAEALPLTSDQLVKFAGTDDPRVLSRAMRALEAKRSYDAAIRREAKQQQIDEVTAELLTLSPDELLQRHRDPEFRKSLTPLGASATAVLDFMEKAASPNAQQISSALAEWSQLPQSAKTKEAAIAIAATPGQLSTFLTSVEAAEAASAKAQRKAYDDSLDVDDASIARAVANEVLVRYGQEEAKNKASERAAIAQLVEADIIDWQRANQAKADFAVIKQIVSRVSREVVQTMEGGILWGLLSDPTPTSKSLVELTAAAGMLTPDEFISEYLDDGPMQFVVPGGKAYVFTEADAAAIVAERSKRGWSTTGRDIIAAARSEAQRLAAERVATR